MVATAVKGFGIFIQTPFPVCWGLVLSFLIHARFPGHIRTEKTASKEGVLPRQAHLPWAPVL